MDARTAPAANELLVRPQPVSDSADRQLRLFIDGKFHRFDQWKSSKKYQRNSSLVHLRQSLDQLLPLLIGARDYAGASKVLSVVYHRFSLLPVQCVQTSLEILRHCPERRDELLRLYQAALEDQRLDRLALLKELWMFHLLLGDFYEAYRLYKDELQQLDVHDDAQLLANFGILCYWLIFVESPELRDKFKREIGDVDVDDFEDEEDEENDMFFSSSKVRLQTTEVIESLIESRYLYKPAIGVHILYQESCSALRRAATMNPSSTIFTECYVQLLLLIGDVEAACDYLEHFYHQNPRSPHASRMLVRFLECYYPESAVAQSSIYTRWLENDPSCGYALEKLMSLAGADVISSHDLLEVLVNALDSIGGDLYVCQLPSVSVTMWKYFAELLVDLDEEELTQMESEDERDAVANAQHVVVAFSGSRAWWKRVFFSRPASIDEIFAITDSEAETIDVWIYRAVVADRMFKNQTKIVNSLHTAIKSGNESIQRSHIHLYRRFFGLNASSKLDDRNDTSSFRTQRYTHVIASPHESQTNPHNLFPDFHGTSVETRVMDRDLLTKSTLHAHLPQIKIDADGSITGVDFELVAALEDAAKDNFFCNKLMESSANLKRRKIGDIFTERDVSIPLYVNLVEEITYKEKKAAPGHLYTQIREMFWHSNISRPTVHEIMIAYKALQVRWLRNQYVYGHPGLLIRYEIFVTKYLREQMLQKGIMPEVSEEMLANLTQYLRRFVSGSHIHFPNPKELEIAARVKATTLLRLRRRRVKEYADAMRWLVQQHVFIDPDDLADITFAVCKQNGHDDIVTLQDLKRWAVSIVAGKCHAVAKQFDEQYKGYLDKLREDGTSQNPRKMLHVQAYSWLADYERANGPIADTEDVDDHEEEN